jgi:hypothetical protein
LRFLDEAKLNLKSFDSEDENLGLVALRNSSYFGLSVAAAIFLIVLAMGLKPSPSGETLRFLYYSDGELPFGSAQPL